ncbi:hypothetical protein ACHHYP_06406 [Achlya hypogyna]|uniref:Uncharacterized protein n=1 Tax=Achlya hypogyna TaxID=1202772 RepID=A0A1V9YTY7_ACHHY|nr:hypothetical protein ACHHYP_06406 [Achlya hypogyna]
MLLETAKSSRSDGVEKIKDAGATTEKLNRYTSDIMLASGRPLILVATLPGYYVLGRYMFLLYQEAYIASA